MNPDRSLQSHRSGEYRTARETLNCLVNDKELSDQMGRKGTIRVKKSFGLGCMVESIDSIYTTVCFARSSRRFQ
jgi:hypothetical protein